MIEQLAKTPLMPGVASDASVFSTPNSEGGITVTLPVFLQNDEAEIAKHLAKSLGAEVSISFDWQPLNGTPSDKAPIDGVKHVIAVASGKGGVGKSTCAANLAIALVQLGARVGVVDADIYGPSQARMLHIEGIKPDILPEKRILPIESPHGVVAIGMGNLMGGDAPMAWRGPMAAGALQQMLRQTAWPDLDFLVVDMPPGTGDIQLTLAQSVPVSGSVIVTTPQDIALLDAKKGIELFRKVSIPVLGVVENMAMHTCSQCGHQEAVFGEHGGDTLVAKYSTTLLGRLPLKLAIREGADSGAPSVVSQPNSEEAQAFVNIARSAILQLFINEHHNAAAAPVFTESDD